MDHAERLGLTMMPHPPYSPDLAPTDFYLIGYIKTILKGTHFETLNELMAAIIAILEKMPHKLLEEVMDEWMHRLNAVIQNNGS